VRANTSGMNEVSTTPGCVFGNAKSILRIEAAALLAALAIAYYQMHASWLLFIVLILAPDVGMIGYLRGTGVGAWSYNAFHSYVGPIIVLAAAVTFSRAALPFAIIWAAHIALDRTLGYGLKYSDSFAHTHLGVIGRRPALP
jgi:hypothetical protein